MTPSRRTCYIARVTDERPSFFARLFLAWIAYFRTLFDSEFAAGVARLRHAPALSAGSESEERPKAAEERRPTPKPIVLKEATPDAACQILGIFQREGRLVDFLQEDVSSFSDADIGAAARVVHEGCRKALDEHFEVEPVRSEEEGAKITLEEGFDATRIRLTGQVVGEPPYSGTLSHRGWCVTGVKLPQLTEQHDPKVLAPAEIEL